ncbi:hypothetical protein ABW19_dt0206372 [Dactylella cylindrospora]|nr:hypothetical protein ABW19_dt0206372 [Dactylella cylindrospora]
MEANTKLPRKLKQAAPATLKNNSKPRSISRRDAEVEKKGEENLPRLSGQNVYCNNNVGGQRNVVQMGDTHNYHAGAAHNSGAGTINMGAGVDEAFRNRRKKVLAEKKEFQNTQNTKKFWSELKKIREAHNNTQASYNPEDAKSIENTIQECNSRVQQLNDLEPKLPKDGKIIYVFTCVKAMAYHLRGDAEVVNAADLEEDAVFSQLTAACSSFEETDRTLASIQDYDDPYFTKAKKAAAKQMCLQAKVDKGCTHLVHAQEKMDNEDESSLCEAMKQITFAYSDMDFAQRGLLDIEKLRGEDDTFLDYLDKATNRMEEIEKVKADISKKLQDFDDKLLEDAKSSTEDEEEDSDDDDSDTEGMVGRMSMKK